MTKVNICGITNLEDALLSAKFGADALGFNFYEKSPRYISPEKAREIIEQLPPEILKVGVFVNETFDKIIEIVSFSKLDALHRHGVETPEFARELKAKTNLEIIKAFRVSPIFKPEDVLQYETDAILLDAYNPKEHGGTGETFDWEIAKKVQEIFPKMYLAGGLSQDNVAKAILETKPFAVDACSCLEREKGKKDKILLKKFTSQIMERKQKNKAIISREDYDHPEHFDDIFRDYRTSERYIPTYLEELLFELSGHSCSICKAPWLEIHHIKHLKDGGETELSNLIVLCPNCHTRVHKDNFPMERELRNYKLKQELNYELPILGKLDKRERDLIIEFSELSEEEKMLHSKRFHFEILQEKADNPEQAKKIARKNAGYLYLEIVGIVAINLEDIVELAPNGYSVALELRLTSKGIKWISYLANSNRINFLNK